MPCRIRRRVLVVFAVFCLGWPAPADAGIAHLILQSEPGDFVGQGKSFDVTYTTPASSISAQIRRRLPDGSPAELLWVLNDGVGSGFNSFALVFFGSDGLGIPIQPGDYPSARRADFAPAGFAGLDISFQNRGSNEVFGKFTINEVTFSADRQEILTFDATFEQHSESPTAPALTGRFQFNAVIPEPSSIFLSTLAAMALAGAGWRRRIRVAFEKG
jgi:hypothetical protein